MNYYLLQYETSIQALTSLYILLIILLYTAINTIYCY